MYVGCERILITSIISLIEGDITNGSKELVQILLPKAVIPRDLTKSKRMVNYLGEVKSLLNFDVITRLISSVETKFSSTFFTNQQTDPQAWNAIFRKIKEGSATSQDLFQVVDQIGNQDGTVDEREFGLLACRLGLKLSSHRIKEIFSKVKGSKSMVGSENYLNQEEFAQALGYLQSKNLTQALLLLGISPEQLIVVFIWLIILLIFIFAFVFLGIKAFALGGTFGALINSLFPAAGAAVLGKKSEATANKLEKNNVQEAADTAFDITVFEEL